MGAAAVTPIGWPEDWEDKSEMPGVVLQARAGACGYKGATFRNFWQEVAELAASRLLPMTA